MSFYLFAPLTFLRFFFLSHRLRFEVKWITDPCNTLSQSGDSTVKWVKSCTFHNPKSHLLMSMTLSKHGINSWQTSTFLGSNSFSSKLNCLSLLGKMNIFTRVWAMVDYYLGLHRSNSWLVCDEDPMFVVFWVLLLRPICKRPLS